MSHLVYSLVCRCGHIFSPTLTHGAEPCPKCHRMVNRPPEPSLPEVQHTIQCTNKALGYYQVVLDEKEYKKLVNEALDRINAEKQYLARLSFNHTNAPVMLQKLQGFLADLERQRKELIARSIADTKRANGHVAKPKKSPAERLRERIGDALFSKLLEGFNGDTEKLVEAFKA